MGSRYINDLKLDIAAADVEKAIQVYLSGNDFKKAAKGGEDYYKTGGILLPLKGFKYSYHNGILHLEAWLGKIGKEKNISDNKAYGILAKNVYHNSILSLINALENAKPKEQQPHEPIEQIPIDVQFQDPANPHQPDGFKDPAVFIMDEIKKANNIKAMLAFWVSIVSLVLIFASRMSLLFIMFSYTFAIKFGLKSEKIKFARIAIAINSVTLLITILLLLT